MKWSESESAKCRWADKLHLPLAEADIVWEDSIVGKKGKVLCIGFHDNKYFSLNWLYDTYVKTDMDLHPTINYFNDASETKKWLKDLKQSGYSKADEVIQIMRFLLT